MGKKLIGLGLVAMLGMVSGCASSGTVTIRYMQGAPCEALVCDSEQVLRIMVARPKIHGNLGEKAAEYWAKRLQTDLEAKLRTAAAKARGVKIEIIACGDDLDELLKQDDMRAAGLVKSDRPRRSGLTDRDVFIAGSVMINVHEEQVCRSVYRPRLGGFSVGGVLGGAANFDDVYVQVRTTSVDATLEMVTNSGTRPVPFVTEEIQPVVSEGGTGGIRLPGMKNETLTALDSDIRIALDRVAPAFVSLLFPREKRDTIEIKSCTNEECRRHVDELTADAADGTVESATAHSVAEFSARHGECEDLRFCMAIAYELAGEFENALDAIHAAIQMEGVKEPSEGVRQSQRTAAALHPYLRTRARLESRKLFEEVRSQMASDTRRSEPEARAASDTEPKSADIVRRR